MTYVLISIFAFLVGWLVGVWKGLTWDRHA